MIRILIAAVLGAAVVFHWGFVSWMVLHMHDHTINEFPENSAITSALTTEELETGWYAYPALPHEDANTSDEEKKKAVEAWTELHKKGPLVNVFVAKGGEPMPPIMFVKGAAIDFVAALIAAMLLSGATCCRFYPMRVGFVAGLGIFAALVSHLALWNWMYMPLDYTLAMMADTVISWTLAGVLMAIVVRPKPEANS